MFAQEVRGVALGVVLAMGILWSPAALAQCANATQPSCSVYKSCFAKYCPCQGTDEYFETYGLKYCNAFLENQNLSVDGKKWRDSTLICLQEEIVPYLKLVTPPSCNCSAMKSIAFNSHVKCYTNSTKSICSLSVSDVNQIRKTIGIKDMVSGDGRTQMANVAAICRTSAPDDGRRSMWKAISAMLSAIN